MKTEAEARAAALAAGIEEPQITLEILAFFGHIVSNPTAGLPVGAVVATETLKADLLTLDEERKNNALPQQILKPILGILGAAKSAGWIPICLALCAVLALAGCGESTQARHSLGRAEQSVKALNTQHLAFEDKFIQEYETKELEKIQQLYAAAWRSSLVQVTTQRETTVKVPVEAADGSKAFKEEKRMQPFTQHMVPENVARGLEAQRMKLITTMKTNVIGMRQQQAEICQNAANAAAYLEGLRAYFEQRQATYETMLAAQEQLLDFLDTFVTSKTEGALLPPPATPPAP